MEGLRSETISFHLGEKIGSGAAGAVHSCINTKTGQPLAVKVIRIPGLGRTTSSSNDNNASIELSQRTTVASSGGTRTLLTVQEQKGAAELAVEQESALMQHLRHPNIVLGYGMQRDPHDSQKLYILMELAALGSLHKVIRSVGRLSESAARSYIRQALLGLKYLHENSVVHRDIKPSNMLLGGSGSVMLADFGISTSLQTATTTRSGGGDDDDNNAAQGGGGGHEGHQGGSSTGLGICGTPAYMSPDAIKGRYSVASDIWAMGCSLLEMVTGRPPWSYHPFQNTTQLMFHIATCGVSPSIPGPHQQSSSTVSQMGVDKHNSDTTQQGPTTQGATAARSYLEVQEAFRRFHFQPEVDCSGLALPDCSPELVTLLAQMLSTDPQQRGDVPTILSHDWFVLDESQLMPTTDPSRGKLNPSPSTEGLLDSSSSLRQPNGEGSSREVDAEQANTKPMTRGGETSSFHAQGEVEKERTGAFYEHNVDATVTDGTINLDGL